MKDLMKRLTELNPELATEMQTEISKLNNEARDNRVGKETSDDILKEMLAKLGASDKDEGIAKVTKNKTELNELYEKFNKIELQLETEKKEKNKAKIESEVVSNLNNFKIKKNFDFMKDSLAAQATIGEDGKLQVGEKSLESYIQAIVDNDVTIVEGKTKKSSHDNTSDLYTEAELDGLSETETAANMEKVNLSLAAL